MLTPDRLVTIRFAPNPIFDTYTEQLPRGRTGHETGAHIFIGLMEAMVDRQADALEQVSADLESYRMESSGWAPTKKAAASRKSHPAPHPRPPGPPGRPDLPRAGNPGWRGPNYSLR